MRCTLFPLQQGHLESLIRKEQAERELEIAESKRTVEGNCKAIETNRKVLEAALKVVVDNQKNVDAVWSNECCSLVLYDNASARCSMDGGPHKWW